MFKTAVPFANLAPIEMAPKIPGHRTLKNTRRYAKIVNLKFEEI